MKLGAVCGIGWVVEPHEKGKETKGGSIARTTWQELSRLNEANSLPLSPSLSVSPSSFLPPLLSRHSLSLAASFPSLSLEVELSPCRARWARPRTDRNRFWEDEESEGTMVV